MVLHLRPLSAEEATTIQQLARSRTKSARLVERAEMRRRAAAGDGMGVIAATLGCNVETVRLWVKRFDAHGLAGLQDRPRAGRPPTYTPEEVGKIIAVALTRPTDLGLPFGSWTLDRLAVYLCEQCGITMKRSRIDEILIAEGLRWRTQETWFGDRVDPDFARTRGRSSRSLRSRHRAV